MKPVLAPPARPLVLAVVVLSTALGALAVHAPGAAAATQSLSLTATAGPTSVSKPGQTVSYTFVARNTGSVSLSHLLVSAPIPGVSALVCTPVALGGTLAAAQSTTCRATRTTTVADLSTAALTGTAKATAVGGPAGSTTTSSASSTVSVAVKALAPKATDDTVGVIDEGPDVFLPGASNDLPGEPGGPAIDPSRTVFASGVIYPGDDGRQAFKDYATWSTLPDGSVRVSLDGLPLVGTVPTIDYRVYDTAGHSSVGHLRVLVRPGPRAVAHHATTPQSQAVTIDVAGSDSPGQNADATPGAFDRATLKVFAANAAFPRTEGLDAKSVDLAGAGRFAVVGGKITFTPAVGFVGRVPAAYEVYTTSGVRLDSTLDVTVQPVAGGPGPVRPVLPVATDDHIVTTTQLATALPAQQNDVPGSSPFVNSKLTFPTDQVPHLPTGSTVVYGDGIVTLTVPGQGRYETRPGTQDILFTPATGFVGDATPVDYRVTDSAGNSARATLTVTVIPGITARWDYVTTRQGHRVTKNIGTNDDHGVSSSTWTALPVSSPRLTTRGNPGAVVSGTYQEKLVVPGQGVYSVSPGNGVVTFDPEPGFVGVSTVTLGVTYEVQRPDIGTQPLAFETKLSVTVLASTPVARADSASTSVGHPVVVPVLGNDSPGSPVLPLVGSSVRLRLSAGLPTGSTLSGDTKTLTVPGWGVFGVSGTGQVTYVPLGTATGKVPAVGYQVADTNGTTARASLTVTVH